MYRTVKTHELVLKGIPDSLRAEIWLIFSGAVTEVYTREFLLLAILSNEASLSMLTRKKCCFYRNVNNYMHLWILSSPTTTRHEIKE
jgi:hypothetical protein